MKQICSLCVHILQIVLVVGRSSQIQFYNDEYEQYQNDDTDLYQSQFDDSENVKEIHANEKDHQKDEHKQYIDYSNPKFLGEQADDMFESQDDSSAYNHRSRKKLRRQKGFRGPAESSTRMPKLMSNKMRRKGLNWEALIKDFYNKIPMGNNMTEHISQIMRNAENGDRMLQSLTDKGYGSILPAVFTGLGAGLLMPTYHGDKEGSLKGMAHNKGPSMLDKTSLPEFYLLFGETGAGAGRGAAEGAGLGAASEAGKGAGVGAGLGAATNVAQVSPNARGQNPQYMSMLNYAQYMHKRKGTGAPRQQKLAPAAPPPVQRAAILPPSMRERYRARPRPDAVPEHHMVPRPAGTYVPPRHVAGMGRQRYGNVGMRPNGMGNDDMPDYYGNYDTRGQPYNYYEYYTYGDPEAYYDTDGEEVGDDENGKLINYNNNIRNEEISRAGKKKQQSLKTKYKDVTSEQFNDVGMYNTKGHYKPLYDYKGMNGFYVRYIPSVYLRPLNYLSGFDRYNMMNSIYAYPLNSYLWRPVPEHYNTVPYYGNIYDDDDVYDEQGGNNIPLYPTDQYGNYDSYGG